MGAIFSFVVVPRVEVHRFVLGLFTAEILRFAQMTIYLSVRRDVDVYPRCRGLGVLRCCLRFDKFGQSPGLRLYSFWGRRCGDVGLDQGFAFGARTT